MYAISASFLSSAVSPVTHLLSVTNVSLEDTLQAQVLVPCALTTVVHATHLLPV
jgi:hypothetical protein